MRTKIIAAILAAVVGVPAAGALAARSAPPASEAKEPETTATTLTALSAVDVAVAEDADLHQACQEDGPDLVAKEKAGTIDPLEQAALDALRPICDDAGMALAAKPQPEAPVQVITVVEQPPATAVASGSSSRHDDEDDEKHEDHEDHEKDD